MNEIGILVAFLAGIVSFASPCCLPLVPAYVSYMVVANPDGTPAPRRAAFKQSLAFVVGFAVVFMALWATVGLIGYVVRDYVGILQQIGGAVLVFMGLHVAGVISISTLYREVHLPIGPIGGAVQSPEQATPTAPSYGRSALLGVVFAAGWTPCIGPILGGIIGLASVSSSALQGTVLLLAYVIGLGVPFVLVAIGATAVSHRLGWLRRHDAGVSFVTGTMLVAVGFLMITDTFARLSGLMPSIGI